MAGAWGTEAALSWVGFHRAARAPGQPCQAGAPGACADWAGGSCHVQRLCTDLPADVPLHPCCARPSWPPVSPAQRAVAAATLLGGLLCAGASLFSLPTSFVLSPGRGLATWGVLQHLGGNKGGSKGATWVTANVWTGARWAGGHPKGQVCTAAHAWIVGGSSIRPPW